MHPRDRAASRRWRTASRVTLTTRRGAATLHGEADADDPRGHRVRAVSLGRRAIGQSPDQRRARSDQPDAGIQGLRRARRRERDAIRHDAARSVWSSSATAWPARGWSRRCSPAADAIGSRSPSSATSRTATTTASCCRACSPGSHDSERHLHQPAAVVRAQRRDAARRRARRGDRPRSANRCPAPRTVVEPYDTLVIATGSRAVHAAASTACEPTTAALQATASSSSARSTTAIASCSRAETRSARGGHRRRPARPRSGAGAAEPRPRRARRPPDGRT